MFVAGFIKIGVVPQPVVHTSNFCKAIIGMRKTRTKKRLRARNSIKQKGGEWNRYSDATDVWYVNSVTGESVWKLPQPIRKTRKSKTPGAASKWVTVKKRGTDGWIEYKYKDNMTYKWSGDKRYETYNVNLKEPSSFDEKISQDDVSEYVIYLDDPGDWETYTGPDDWYTYKYGNIVYKDRPYIPENMYIETTNGKTVTWTRLNTDGSEEEISTRPDNIVNGWVYHKQQPASYKFKIDKMEGTLSIYWLTPPIKQQNSTEAKMERWGHRWRIVPDGYENVITGDIVSEIPDGNSIEKMSPYEIREARRQKS